MLIVGFVASIALGAGTSIATLNSGTSVNVQIKHARAPATITLTVDNSETAVVPQPVSTMRVSSSTAKWNTKAVTQCTTPPPNYAVGDNHGVEPSCPASSRVGKGTFAVNTGTPGQPIPGDLGTLSGTINVYNHTPAAGQAACFFIELLSDTPVPNDHEWEVAQISKSGTVVVPLLKMEDLHPQVKNILSPPTAPRQLALSKLKVTIKSPTPKKGKAPFVTLKSVKKVDFSITLERG
jgi:hypothetical protein